MSDSLKKSRNSNIETLRIISMLMIVILHYFNQGGLLENTVVGTANYNITWLLEAFCYVSVNCYVLISGYFLCTAPNIKIGKILEIIAQVLFYSIGIYFLFCTLGIEQFRITTFVSTYFFPLIKGKYWFAGVYVILLFAVPYVNKLINVLNKEEHRRILVIFGVIFTVIPTLLFFAGDSPSVSGGYSLIWFIYLYVLAAYLRKYDVNLKKRYLVMIALISGIITFAVKLLQNFIFKTEYWDFYNYNSITVLIGSICLFLLFIKMKPRNIKFVNTIAATTFGVYLIHTHTLLSNKLWTEWINPKAYINESAFLFILYLLVSVILIFVVCSIIDLFRIYLFKFAKYLIKRFGRGR